MENSLEKKAPPTRLKKKSSPEIKSFAEAVVGTKHEAPSGIVRVSVGEDEVTERLRRLSYCLVGWWGGGTLHMPDLKTIKRRAWPAWEVRGSLNVEEMGKVRWLFEFDNEKEAKRILRIGTRKLGGWAISLKRWTREDGCITDKNIKEAAWVRLIGLPIRLWGCPILRRIGDRCGSFLAMDEDTTFLFDLCWARIRVKWNGNSLPLVVEVLEGLSRYEIHLWWEIQPSLRSASVSGVLEHRNEVREEEEGARVGESVSSEGRQWEKTDGTKEVPLGREKQFVCLIQKQTGEEVSRWDPFCGVGLVLGFSHRVAGLGQPGPHNPTQTSWPRENMPGLGLREPIKIALGAFSRPAQVLHLDQHSRFSKVLTSASLLKDSQAACKKGSKAKEREEGVFINASVDEHRYVVDFTVQSPSLSFWPTPVFWGVLRPGRSLDDLEPLRVVAADESEWGLENSGALIEAEEGLEEDGLRSKEVQSMSSEGSTYENWEDSCLVKFSEFLGFFLRWA